MSVRLKMKQRKYTSLFENEQNEREKLQWRLLCGLAASWRKHVRFEPRPGGNFINNKCQHLNNNFWPSNVGFFPFAISYSIFGIQNAKNWHLFLQIGILNTQKEVF